MKKDIADETWGPAMRALPTDRWRAAAIAYVAGSERRGTNDKGYTSAAIKAGYTGKHITQTAYQMFNDNRMKAALQELVRDEMKLGAPVAKRTLLDIMQTPGHKDQFNAAKSVLDRAGIVQQLEIKHTVEHSLTMDHDMVYKLSKLANELGVDKRKLLGWRHGS